MADRKARIAALAARSGRTQNIVGASAGGGVGASEDEEPKLLDEAALLPSTIGQRSEPGKALKTKSPLEIALDQARAELIEIQQSPTALPAMATSHKKINWDLKRDIAQKLDVLDRRTQKAIVELLRERLEREVQEEVD